MTFTDIFEELNTIYSEAWFKDAEEKFRNHPSNEKHDDTFLIILDEECFDRFEKVINFEDFAMGSRDQAYDNIHDDIEGDKLETIGFTPDGYFDVILPEGVEYNCSSNLYPDPALIVWQREANSKIDKSLSLITTLAEKELLINSLAAITKEYIDQFKGNSLRSLILSKVLNEINAYLSQVVEEISEMNIFIKVYNPKFNALEFNLGQEELAALLLILNKANFLNTNGFNDTSFLKFCFRYFKFKKNDSFKLSNSFKNLSKKYNDIKNNVNPKLLNNIIKKLNSAMTEL